MAENKPVMIDGVDVSECKLYRDEISFVGGEIYTDVCSIWIWQRDYRGLEPSCVMKCHCKDNPNCLFKQLAYKTQKCEELKKQLERKEANYQKLLNKSNKYIHNLVDENVKDISNLARQLNQLKSANEQAE